MGSVKAISTTLSAYSQLKFITPVRAVFAASAPSVPFRRDRFRGRSPADAKRREESALGVHSKAFAHFFSCSAAPSPERWQCRPNIRRPSPFASRAPAGPAFAAPPWGRKARRSAHSSSGKSHSSAQSLHRSPGKPSGPIPQAPVRFSHGAETIRADAAPGALLVAGSESSLLNFFFSFFTGFSR